MINIISNKLGNFEVFHNKNIFIEHVNKHIFDSNQPWDRIFSRKYLKSLCQKIERENVLEMYKDISKKIEEGINFSINKPLYATRSINKTDEILHYFISDKGFIIIARQNIIRTVYFICDNKNISNYRLFKNAWKAVKRKMNKIDYDLKDENIEKIFESKKNWIKCPKLK